MRHRPGETVPATGIYWCTVCKAPAELTAGAQFPECPNMCGRGLWELVKEEGEKLPTRG
jgi:hypothetical protein